MGVGGALGSLETEGFSVSQESPVGSLFLPLSFEFQSNLSVHVVRSRVDQKWARLSSFPLLIKERDKQKALTLSMLVCVYSGG